MKAVVCKAFGHINDVISVTENNPKPTLEKGKGRMLIRVLACSPTVGDTRVFDGSLDLLRKPKTWPYVPGHDVCGIIEELDEGDKHSKGFKVGDRIVTNSTAIFMYGGMAEYASVETAPAVKLPASISAVDGSTLPGSAQRALQTYELADIKAGQRVLLLGASGGYGTFLTQLLKLSEAYVVVTSTQTELMTSLGADEVIDYRGIDIYGKEEYRKDKFDVIIDAECDRKGKRPPWKLCRPIVKGASQRGQFFATAMDNPSMQLHHWYQFLALMWSPLWREFWTGLLRPSSTPRYRSPFLGSSRERLQKMVKMVEEGKVRVVLDPGSPHPFTEQGARDALNTIEGKHAHGKVVIKIADEPESAAEEA